MCAAPPSVTHTFLIWVHRPCSRIVTHDEMEADLPYGEGAPTLEEEDEESVQGARWGAERGGQMAESGGGGRCGWKPTWR